MKLDVKLLLTAARSVSLFMLTAAGGSTFAQHSPQLPKRPPAPLQSNAKLQQIVVRLERTVPQLMKDGDVPGLSIALVRNGEVVWHHGFGVKNAKTNEPVTDDTVFEAASLSKPVFAYAVMKLVENGELDLDKPLNQYLPGDYDVGPDPRLAQITTRRVLSHTTGFPNWRSEGGTLKIYFTPGEKFSYSGEGFVYLSKVVEHLTGKQFDAFMKEYVFDPLGMTSSSYVWQTAFDKLKASRHNSLGEPTSDIKPQRANAAASLQTTARDYGRFVAAILKGTGLKKETLRLMLAAQIKVDEGGSNTTSRPADKLSPTISWGLGWGLQTTSDGLSFWHWGDNGDTKAYVVAFQKEKLGVVVFTNGANGLSIMPEIIAEAIGGQQPALSWLKYDSYKSPSRMLQKNIVAKGADSALRDYREWRKGRAAGEVLNETQMNRLGYNLLQSKRVKDAIEVFKLNVEDYPQSSNTYDSLGEAYKVDGNNELAIKNYQRSVELNPNNAGGIEALKKLRENHKQ
jgi:CubicO group peptidase (beta-lactamase class C family)